MTRWARSLHEASHAIIALSQRQLVPLVEISDPHRSRCFTYDPKPNGPETVAQLAILYAAVIAHELEFGTCVGSGCSADFADAERMLATLPEADRREVAREAWALAKRLVIRNLPSIHFLARRLYRTGRLSHGQIVRLLRGRPRARREPAAA